MNPQDPNLPPEPQQPPYEQPPQQGRYLQPGQYIQPGQYPEQGQYPQQQTGQYPQQGLYPQQGRYPQQDQYLLQQPGQYPQQGPYSPQQTGQYPPQTQQSPQQAPFMQAASIPQQAAPAVRRRGGDPNVVFAVVTLSLAVLIAAAILVVPNVLGASRTAVAGGATSTAPPAAPAPSASPGAATPTFTASAPSGWQSVALATTVAGLRNPYKVRYSPNLAGYEKKTNSFTQPGTVPGFALTDITGTSTADADLVTQNADALFAGYPDTNFVAFLKGCSTLDTPTSLAGFSGTLSKFGPCATGSFGAVSGYDFIFAGTRADGERVIVSGQSDGSDLIARATAVLATFTKS